MEHHAAAARLDSLRLPADSDCEVVFRQYVRLACHQCRRDDLLDRVLLVTNELVTNAIRHSGSAEERFVEVSLAPTRRGVRVQVRDADPTPPVIRGASADDPAGRGLQVVAAVATAWGCRPEQDGKTVWADVDPE